MNRSVDYRKAILAIESEAVYDIKTGFVNSLDVDRLQSQYLLCGAADSSISIHNLKSPSNTPVARIDPKTNHKYGVSKVQWWAHDNGMFVSGSFDNTIRLWDADALEAVYTFDVESKVYNLDTNDDGIIAAGLDYPYIRLLDTRSGSQSHILKGHHGKVLSVKWSPTSEYYLASGGSDGTVKVWDIRQSHPLVESMDMARTTPAKLLEDLEFRKSHRAAINGLAWLDSGDRLISTGNDNKIRVWNLNVSGGLHEGINYGPMVQNRFLQNNDPLVTSSKYPFAPCLFVGNDSGTILIFDVNSGKLIKQLVPPKRAAAARQACICSRGYPRLQFFSGDGDGVILKWSPRLGKPQNPTQATESLIKAQNAGNDPASDSGAPKRYRLGDFLTP